MANSFKLLT